MSNSIAPGSSADINVKVTALTTNPNVPAQYKTIILKKNLVNGVNILTQEMMSAANTKYVIKYDYVLGEDITVPINSILCFDGGSISASGNNDTITGQNTGIQAGLVKIFETNVVFAGTWLVSELYVSWFGADNNGNIDSTDSIQATINFAKNCFILNIVFSEFGKYLITDTIISYKSICLDGHDSCIYLDHNSEATVIIRLIDNPVTNSVFNNPHVNIKNITIDGYSGGWNGGVPEDSLIQDTQVLCRQNVTGISLEWWGLCLDSVSVTHCYYGIASINKNHTYNLVLNHVHVRHSYYGIYFTRTADLDTGESLNITNSNISNNVKAIYTNRWGIFISTCQLDYNRFICKECWTREAFAYLNFSNCHIENMTSSDSWFVDNLGTLNFENCIFVPANTNYLFETTPSFTHVTIVNLINSVIISSGVTIASPDVSFDYRIQLNCYNNSIDLYQNLILTKESYNLIKNGNLATTDASAFYSKDGQAITIETDSEGKHYVQCEKVMYKGNTIWTKFYPKKKFYLYIKTDIDNIRICNIWFYDRDDQILLTKEFYGHNNWVSISGFELPPNTDYVEIREMFVGETDTNHITGIWVFEF